MDPLTAVLIAEGAEDTDKSTWVTAWQHLIDTGLVWKLQGYFGRQAQRLIDDGTCRMPPQTEEQT